MVRPPPSGVDLNVVLNVVLQGYPVPLSLDFKPIPSMSGKMLREVVYSGEFLSGVWVRLKDCEPRAETQRSRGSRDKSLCNDDLSFRTIYFVT
jgi:hypothetical protein